MPGRSRALLAYTAAVGLAGAALVGGTLAQQTGDALQAAPLLLWVLVGCVVVAELLPISLVVRGQQGELLTSSAFAFALLIAFGPGVAVPALAVASLVGDLAHGRRFDRLVFNFGQGAIAMWVTGVLMGAVTAVPRLPLQSFVGTDLPVLLLCGIVFFALSVSLGALRGALASGYTVWASFAGDFLLQSSTAGYALLLAPLMVVIGEFSVGMLPLLALPMIAIYRNSRQAIVNEHQALHDALTGLPNRVLFHDRVRQAIESARRNGQVSAVMIMDLDHFKEINDTLGHYHGDRLLQLVGERLGSVLRAEDTVARLGGDEFAVLLPSVGGHEYADDVAAKSLEALGKSFEIDGLTLEVGASIGIACFPAHGEDGETLLQRADIAMYVAKAAHSGWQRYEMEQDQHSIQRLALAGELRRAIENGELVLHYQPKIDVASGRVVGA
ncbi:MAG: hypothetical protein QOF76_3554, partial [Solirubrobacteraceae bacterium]|nr:hypothetical protein [Solirubrobacteraceae bacterium]